MAVRVNIYWFDRNGKNVAITHLKVTDNVSRKRMENTVRNLRFDDLYINRDAEKKIKEHIYKQDYHLYFTAVVIDDILLDPIYIKPERP